MKIDNGKIKQERVMTAIEGSYPKPEYLFPGSGRELLDNFGLTFYGSQNTLGETEFKNRLDKAVLTAIRDQNSAGIDFITDGEERRGHYVLHIQKKLRGIDFGRLRKKSIRGGGYSPQLPAVIDRITYYKDILGWLSESLIDIVSIEGAQNDLDLSILPAIGRKGGHAGRY